MFDRLDDMLRHYEELMLELNNPSVAEDQRKFRKLMKEQADLAPIVDAYKQYKQAKQDVEDSLALLDEESDEEMKELAKEELADAKKRIEELEQELKILLLPKDPNDEKNVIVEIRAGAGGDEAALFASELYRMYVHYAESQHWKTEMINVSESGIGGMKEVEFMITGHGAYSKLKYESGVHRVQRVPETESGGRIHTSTVSRAIKGKYIQYPCGTILMKHLFTASVSAAEGSDAVGTMQIKELMKELIRNEDKNKPYSDQKLSSLLKERGIEISRRAVAKYREELGIRGSFPLTAFQVIRYGA